MSDAKQLKAQGLRFGRSFQMAIRTSVMFTADHPSLERPIEQSFNLLNELLKQFGQFTIGFVDNQILINTVLTTDPALAQLEKEFLKRGIAAFTFEAGLTLARYRRIIAVLSAAPTVIEQAGGIREYLELNELQGGRIVAASRNQKKTESGDTLIETDSEAYILSKQMAEEGPRDFMESLDALLESACLDPATRTAALAGLTAADPNAFGQGYGVPVPVPNLVIDKDSAPGTGWAPNGVSDGNNQTNGTGNKGSGFGGTTGRIGSGAFTGTTGDGQLSVGASIDQPQGSQAAHSGYVITDPAGEPRSYESATGGGYRTFIELVQDSVSRSLTEDKGNPRKSYLSLARILKDSRLDSVLSYFPPEKRDELRTLPPEQLAAEYVEENTLKLIAKKLVDTGRGQRDKFIVEEDVLRLLARSLQATHMADRLAFKLAKFFQDFSVPPHLQSKIQDELRWTALSSRQKYLKLMELSRYDFTGFRRLQEFSKELIAQHEPEKLLELTAHYFAFLDESKAHIEPEELSRAIDVIRGSKIGKEAETDVIINRLGKVLLRDDVTELVHFQAANSLAVLSQSSSVYEAFDKVLNIAELLRQSANRAPEQHRKCCLMGLSRMLAPSAIDRLIEIYIANRTDANMTRTAAAILRHASPAGPEAVLKQLVEEKNANNRIALLRLIAQIGPACLEAARNLLRDERWYVVRNMCNLLAELRDPELANYLNHPLRHLDDRVQQAALNALIKTRAEGRADLIADSLTELSASVVEPALDELLFLRAPDCVPGLKKFLLSKRTAPIAAAKGLRILSSIVGDAATAALDELVVGLPISSPLRQQAQDALRKREPKIAAETPSSPTLLI
jgi:HEAT repeats